MTYVSYPVILSDVMDKRMFPSFLKLSYSTCFDTVVPEVAARMTVVFKNPLRSTHVMFVPILYTFVCHNS